MTITNKRKSNNDELSKCACLAVTGVTASGKTRLAVQLARHFNGEIISVDSRQVYKKLDLGTGKDLEEYGTGEQRVPVHLIDIVEPVEKFHLFKFLQLARQSILEVRQKGRLPILAGGSTLYLQALLDGYQMPGEGPDPELRQTWQNASLPELIEMLRQEASPELFARSDLTQPRRVIRALEIARSGENTQAYCALDNCLILAPRYPREVCHQRIEIRLDQRLQQGMIEEVRKLQQDGMSWQDLHWLGLEYRCIAEYLQGISSLEEMRLKLLAQIRQFCKRQDTWFRKMQKEGKTIHWLDEANPEMAIKLTSEWLAQQSAS
jgi:tRNA dimethylallyltransferase